MSEPPCWITLQRASHSVLQIPQWIKHLYIYIYIKNRFHLKGYVRFKFIILNLIIKKVCFYAYWLSGCLTDLPQIRYFNVRLSKNTFLLFSNLTRSHLLGVMYVILNVEQVKSSRDINVRRGKVKGQRSAWRKQII